MSTTNQSHKFSPSDVSNVFENKLIVDFNGEELPNSKFYQAVIKSFQELLDSKGLKRGKTNGYSIIKQGENISHNLEFYSKDCKKYYRYKDIVEVTINNIFLHIYESDAILKKPEQYFNYNHFDDFYLSLSMSLPFLKRNYPLTYARAKRFVNMIYGFSSNEANLRTTVNKDLGYSWKLLMEHFDEHIGILRASTNKIYLPKKNLSKLIKHMCSNLGYSFDINIFQEVTFGSDSEYGIIVKNY